MKRKGLPTKSEEIISVSVVLSYFQIQHRVTNVRNHMQRLQQQFCVDIKAQGFEKGLLLSISTLPMLLQMFFECCERL